MAKASTHIQARLHPSDEAERRAIDIWNDWIEAGGVPRKLITALILHHEGYTPESFQLDVDSKLDTLARRIDEKMDEVITRLEHNVADVLRNIKQSDPQGFKRFADSTGDDDDLDEAFILNAQRGVRKTFRQKQAERGE